MISYINLVLKKLLRQLSSLLSVLALREDLIDFLDHVLVGCNVVKETLRNEHAAVVLVLSGSLDNHICDSVYDVWESFSSRG